MWRSTCEQHKNMPILMICMEEGCSERRLCCVRCVDDSHQMHQIISMNKFKHIINRNIETNYHLQKGKIYKLIKQCEEWFLEELKQIENEFTLQIQQCQAKLKDYFYGLHRAFSLPENSIIISDLEESITSSKVSCLLEDIKFSQKHKFGTAKETEKMIYFEQDIFSERIIQLKQEIKQKMKSFSEGLDQIRLSSKRSSEPMYFHKSFRSFLLNIEDSETAVSKINTQGGRPIQLANRLIDPVNNMVSFKIIKNGEGVKSICLGLCLLNVVKSHNYTNCIGYRKGTYGLDQSSYSGWGIQQSTTATSFSHCENVNHSLPYQIDEGDVINFEVDFESMDLIVWRNDEEDEWTMPIKVTEHRALYPFVSLSNLNSIVEILTQ